MKQALSKLIGLETVIVLYWFGFWLVNGLDKMFHNTNLGVFHWFGKDRELQVTAYFSSLNMPEDMVAPALHVIGVWEIYLSLVFLCAGVCIILSSRHVQPLIRVGFFLAAFTFIGFTVFDVMTGDRFEVLEHGVYFGLVVLSWFVFNYRRSESAESTG